MSFSVTLNGNTYTDANFNGNNYALPSTGLPALMQDFVQHGANLLQAVSTNSLTPTLGVMSITISLNRPYMAGMTLRLQRIADSSCFLQGPITAYSAATGAVTINVTSFSTGASGSGAFSDWIIFGLGLQGPTGPAGSVSAGGTVSGTLNYAGAAENWATVSLAAASTMAIGAASANVVSVTGAGTISAFDTVQAGAIRILIFTSPVTLNHNPPGLMLPWNMPLMTAVNDSAIMLSLGSGAWVCIAYTFANLSPTRANRRARLAAALI
jgi:hypothetical protein